MLENINTRSYWEEQWKDRSKKGWIKKKLRYQFLSLFAPRYVLTSKPRSRYYLGVAKLAKGSFCDLGCGMGVTGGIYSALTGNQSFGMDYSLPGLKAAEREAERFKVPCYYLAGDLYNVGIKSNYFDTVYLGQVLEHLDDDMVSLAEAVRILKPGGKLIVSVPNENMPDDPEHINEYTKESLTTMFTSVGGNSVEFHNIDRRRFVVSSIVEK